MKPKMLTPEMEQKMYQLVNGYLSIGGNHKVQKSKEIRSKIQEFMKEYGMGNILLDDIMRFISIDLLSKNIFYYKEAEHIIEPTLKRLYETENWDETLTRIASRAVSYGGNLVRELNISERVIEFLENNSKEEFYVRGMISVHNNRLNILLRYYYLNINVPNINVGEEFLKSVEIVLSLSEEHNDIVNNSVASIKKGLYDRNEKLMERGYDALISIGEKEVIDLMRAEENRFNFFIYGEIGELIFRDFVSRALRNERESRNYKAEDLANNIGISISTITEAENGNKGLSLYSFYKLAEAFNISMDSFLNIKYANRHLEPETVASESLIDLFALAQKLPEHDQNVIVATVRAMIKENLHK